MRRCLRSRRDSSIDETAGHRRLTELLARHAIDGEDLDAVLAIGRVTERVTNANVRRAARVFAGKANRATLTLLPER